MRLPATERARAWRAAALVLGAAVLSVGCGPLTLVSFLWPADTRVPPDCPLACEGKKETRVVVLASSSSLDTHADTNGADQDLAERLATVLKRRYAEARQKVTLVPHYQVRDYRNKNPVALTPYEVGKHFAADKVVDLQVSGIGLYKEGSAHTLLQGHVELTVTVTDMSQPREAGPVFQRDYQCDYPRGHEIPADGRSPSFFRSRLLDHVATDLARYFTPFEPDEGKDERGLEIN